MREQLVAWRRGVTLATIFSVSAFIADARAYTGDQEQACTGDAFRLCASDIPNVDRITACMIRRQAELSPGCRVFFRASEPAVKPVTLRRFGEGHHLHIRKPHKAHHKPHHRH